MCAPLHLLGRLAQHPVHRELVLPAAHVRGQHDLEGRHLHLVDADGARDRVAAEAIDQVPAAGDDPGLRTAEQLVPGARDEVGAVGEGLAQAGLVGRHAVVP